MDLFFSVLKWFAVVQPVPAGSLSALCSLAPCERENVAQQLGPGASLLTFHPVGAPSPPSLCALALFGRVSGCCNESRRQVVQLRLLGPAALCCSPTVWGPRPQVSGGPASSQGPSRVMEGVTWDAGLGGMAPGKEQ